MPDPGHLTDAARYIQHLCFSITKPRLDRLSIRLLCSADDLRLEGERCWKLGLIVSELLTNVARHARFDDRHPEAKVTLLLAGNVVRCEVSDNGCGAEGSSFLLTFALTESEQRAAGATQTPEYLP